MPPRSFVGAETSKRAAELSAVPTSTCWPKTLRSPSRSTTAIRATSTWRTIGRASRSARSRWCFNVRPCGTAILPRFGVRLRAPTGGTVIGLAERVGTPNENHDSHQRPVGSSDRSYEPSTTVRDSPPSRACIRCNGAAETAPPVARTYPPDASPHAVGARRVLEDALPRVPPPAVAPVVDALAVDRAIEAPKEAPRRAKCTGFGRVGIGGQSGGPGTRRGSCQDEEPQAKDEKRKLTRMTARLSLALKNRSKTCSSPFLSLAEVASLTPQGRHTN